MNLEIFIREQLGQIKSKVGKGIAICATSGGVDSMTSPIILKMHWSNLRIFMRI